MPCQDQADREERDKCPVVELLRELIAFPSLLVFLVFIVFIGPLQGNRMNTSPFLAINHASRRSIQPTHPPHTSHHPPHPSSILNPDQIHYQSNTPLSSVITFPSEELHLQLTMHLTQSLLLALPALAVATQAQQPAQKPLAEQASDWFNHLKNYVSNAVPTAASAAAASAAKGAAKDPIGASAAKVAARNVTPLTMSNYESFLTPDPSSPHSPHEYMIFISGGNKTCSGHCTHLERVWNETAAILSADPTAPSLAYINCDTQGPLCATWQAKPPTIWHIQRPVPNVEEQSTPASTIFVNYLNVTSTTVGDMISLHSGKKFEDGVLYEGYFHPIDGPLAKMGVNKVVGYVMWGVGLVPSWAFMVVISMVSRTIM